MREDGIGEAIREIIIDRGDGHKCSDEGWKKVVNKSKGSYKVRRVADGGTGPQTDERKRRWWRQGSWRFEGRIGIRTTAKGDGGGSGGGGNGGGGGGGSGGGGGKETEWEEGTMK